MQIQTIIKISCKSLFHNRSNRVTLYHNTHQAALTLHFEPGPFVTPNMMKVTQPRKLPWNLPSISHAPIGFPVLYTLHQSLVSLYHMLRDAHCTHCTNRWSRYITCWAMLTLHIAPIVGLAYVFIILHVITFKSFKPFFPIYMQYIYKLIFFCICSPFNGCTTPA